MRHFREIRHTTQTPIDFVRLTIAKYIVSHTAHISTIKTNMTKHTVLTDNHLLSLTGDTSTRGKSVLQLYSVYALLFALAMTVVQGLDEQNQYFGRYNPRLFLIAVTMYVMLTTALAIGARRHVSNQQFIAYLFSEVALLAMIMYASEGTISYAANILLIPLLIANLLSPNMLGIALAAWTSIAFLLGSVIWPQNFNADNLVKASSVGLSYFAVALLTQIIAKRLDSALIINLEQKDELHRLRLVTQQVIRDLPFGVVICDQNHRILMINHAAHTWLGLHNGTALPNDLIHSKDEFTLQYADHELNVRKLHTKEMTRNDYVLVIDNSEQVAVKVQQAKLASLGRLTASIAHEIRNPLSAIRQASQLLTETPHLQAPERRLTHIIEQHCMRINQIIEDVLQLSKRRAPYREAINLHTWVRQIVRDFREQHAGVIFEINANIDEDVTVQFDPLHLQHVIGNLLNNGLRHAQKQTPDDPRLFIEGSHHQGQYRVNVIDNGGGIEAEQAQHLFEPFYTTEHTGTGLGLYLCKSLCEANNAQIHYHATDGGSCFSLLLEINA